ncbi:hypothetical protein AB1Y20_018623 [Prymnesium parvum]|uniref:Uncharacterized protein n=1 Tax=Prymnesium parvum TaxID=97485 RepID=A0AB34JRN4_PRYPA
MAASSIAAPITGFSAAPPPQWRRRLTSSVPSRRILIWHNRHVPWLPYLYAPVTGTLVAAFSQASHTEVILGWGTKRNDAPPFVGNLSALRRGDVYIWVGMGTDWELVQSPWRELRARGIHTVLYQTEPAHHCAVSYDGKWPVDELWDFSWHNLEPCEAQGGPRFPWSHLPGRALLRAPTLRYVPLGYLPQADVRVMPPTPRAAARPLFFFGDTSNNPKRHTCYKQLKKLLGQSVKHTYRAFNDAGYAKVVLAFDIHVNLHKECGDAHNPITFRVAKLLNARKLIISEHAHPKDEEEFAGMLVYADNMSHVAALYRSLAQYEWRERARVAAARFRRKFQPVDIFKRARIYESLGLELLHVSD